MSILDSFSANPSQNISYLLLVAAWAQNFVCGTRVPLLKMGLDNNLQPRETIAKLEAGKKVGPDVVRKLKLHMAAQQNGFESLIMMAAAVVAGNQAGLGAQYMNRVTGVYLVLRILYTYFYLNATSVAESMVRSLCFVGGAGCFVTTLVKASALLK